MDWTTPEGQQVLEAAAQLRQKGMTWHQIAHELGTESGDDALRKAVSRRLKQAPTQEPQDSLSRAARDLQGTIDDLKLEAENKQLRGLVNQLLGQATRTEVIKDAVVTAVQALPRIEVPRVPPVDGPFDEEHAVLCLGDVHVGQAVRAEETGGLGLYNRAVFQERLHRLVNSTRKILAIHTRAYRIPRLHIFMLGDLVEGELIYRGQQMHIDMNTLQQALQASQELAAALPLLLEYADYIDIHAVPGNHGRVGRKGETQYEVNFDVVVYNLMQAYLKEYADRIAWNISTAPWTIADVHGWDFLVEHGDRVKSWNQLPFYGFMRRDARMHRMLSSKGLGYNYYVIGHHHNPGDIELPDGTLILNGTWVGGSEFSINDLATMTRPSQQLFGVHPKKGKTWEYRLYLD